jgi:hypothetical protein
MNNRRLGGKFIQFITMILLAGLTWSITWAASGTPPPQPINVEPWEKESGLYPQRESRMRPASQAVGYSREANDFVDEFGYILDDSVPFSWIDISTETEVGFDSGDDSYFGPVNLGFDFKFYENTYSEVFINTNGTLNFGDGSSSFDNQPMPQTAPPNNIVAPFWDDLAIGDLYNSGKVYYAAGGVDGDRYFVVAWEQVTRFGDSDLLTFEVVLYESGEILFQYLNLNGELSEATVGIEDAEGVDGLVYVHNASGLSSGAAVRFNRPPAEARVKFLATYQSNLTEKNRAAYAVALRNTGELGTDVYNLSVASSDPGWNVTLFDGVTGIVLSDTDFDGRPDTGPLAQGDSFTVEIVVNASIEKDVGDHTIISLTATSSQNPGEQSVTSIEAAIPASFAQAFSDNQLGTRLEFIWETRHTMPGVGSGSSSSLALITTGLGHYVYAWEKFGLNFPTFYSNIEYVLLDGYGRTIQDVQIIEDHSSTTVQTMDRTPTLAAAQNGRIGITWVRDIFDTETLKSNSNIYFAILDASGTLLSGPINVTMNDGWLGEGDLDIPSFTSPAIAATSDNRFVLSWTDGRQRAGGESQDIGVAVYDTQSNLITAQQGVARTETAGYLYLDPGLAPLDEAKVFLSYTAYDPNLVSYQTVFVVLNSSGTNLISETALSTGQGWGPDAIHMGNGNIAVAWTDPSSDEITFAFLDGTTYSMIAGPVTLDNPDSHPADFVSVTTDPDGRLVLTWMDAKWNQALYYALVSTDGQVVTPAMIFRAGQGDIPLIKTSYSGQGASLYEGALLVFLPLLLR